MSEKTVTLSGGTIIEAGGMSFTVQPESYPDFVRCMEFSRKLQDIDPDLLNYGVSRYSVMCRIAAWDGPVTPDRKPAPCTEAAKAELFGKRPDLIDEITRKLIEQEASASKNLETSQSG